MFEAARIHFLLATTNINFACFFFSVYADLDEYSDKSNDAVPDITQRIAALESIYSRRLSSSRSEDTLE